MKDKPRLITMALDKARRHPPQTRTIVQQTTRSRQLHPIRPTEVNCRMQSIQLLRLLRCGRPLLQNSESRRSVLERHIHRMTDRRLIPFAC